MFGEDPVELRMPGELDVFEITGHLARRLALAAGNQGDYRTLRGGVANRADPIERNSGHQPDGSGARRIQIAPKRSRQKHFVQVFGLDAHARQKQLGG